jgi:hypothetical protein
MDYQETVLRFPELPRGGWGAGIKKNSRPSMGGPAKNLYTQWEGLSFAERIGLDLRG